MRAAFAAYRLSDFPSRRSCSAWIIFSSQCAKLLSSSRAISSAHFLKRGLIFAPMAAERISDSGFFFMPDFIKANFKTTNARVFD
jgi:uncharacterized membrane protein